MNKELFMSRRGFARGLFAAAGTAALPGFAAEAPLEETRRWFAGAGFGMMAHWGLYSLLAGEWNGDRSGSYGEWLQWKLKIPVAEMKRYAAAFNPVDFRPKDWMKIARDAGMKYFTFTSKHHEGFAMFRSKASKFNIVDATPFRRDIVEEIAEACRETGIRLGLYYSQAIDWSDPDGSGYNKEHHSSIAVGGNRSWANDWDWPDKTKKDYRRCYERKIVPQVEEILTQYGEISLLWFDTPVGMTREQSQGLVELVRRHQPGCLINSRIGNGVGDYVSTGDNELPERDKGGKIVEMCATMNHTWGWRPADVDYKSVEEIRAIREKCHAVGANYLLNISPDHLGRIPYAQREILRKLG